MICARLQTEMGSRGCTREEAVRGAFRTISEKQTRGMYHFWNTCVKGHADFWKNSDTLKDEPWL